MSDQTAYTPAEATVRWVYAHAPVDLAGCDDQNPHPGHAIQQFDRFVAKVKRDAAREALDGAEKYALRRHEQAGFALRADGWRFAQQAVGDYRETHYPEETP